VNLFHHVGRSAMRCRSRSETLSSTIARYTRVEVIEKGLGMTIQHRRFSLIACAIVGWALCAVVMGIGMGLTTVENTLIVHAVAAPLIFGVLAAVYFCAFPDASVVGTAGAWLGIVMLLDLIVVAALILRSLAMFQTPLGTWLPFALIFLSVLAVGEVHASRRRHAVNSLARQLT
jgi:hypothetical protein